MERSRALEQGAFHRAVKERLARDMELGLATGAVAVSQWDEVLAFVTQGLAATDESLARLSGAGASPPAPDRRGSGAPWRHP